MTFVAALATPDAGRAQISRAGAWDGPGDVCSADTLLGDWGGMRSQLANYGIGFGLQEQTEVWGNLVGGIKRGATYDGLTTADLCIDLDKALQWPGAKIFSYGFQIWGPGPTHDYVGALQLISSIEATPSTKLYDLWFEQDLFDGKVSFRFGQGGVDSQGFMTAPYDTLIHDGDYAFYAIANQMLWHKPNTEGQGIGVFLQVMHGPEDRNINDLFIEAGVNWKGPLPNRSHDEAGITLTYAGIGSAARQYSRDVVFNTGVGSPYAQGEPIIEATHRLRLTPWFKLQPDLQYVINTGAGIPTAQAPTPLKNALVISMRASVNFDPRLRTNMPTSSQIGGEGGPGRRRFSPRNSRIGEPTLE